MKKASALFLCIVFLLLTACGQKPSEEVAPTSETSVQTQEPEPITSDDVLSANDSYGKTKKTDDVRVRDESLRYRTEDSHVLEPIAVRFALDRIRDTLTKPNSLQVTDCLIWDCVDDGEQTYYNISFSLSYIVDTGERLKSGRNTCVGVRKSDKTAFDAADEIDSVIDAYSVFRQTRRNAVCTFAAGETDIYASAARQIAASRLKKAESGKVISARQRLYESDRTVSVWDVLCEGENDFGMFIPDVYTVYIRYVDGKIFEMDPADSDAYIF